MNLKRTGTACVTSTELRKCKAVGVSAMNAAGAAGGGGIRAAQVDAGAVDAVTQELHPGAGGAGRGVGKATEQGTNFEQLKKAPR